MAPVVGKDSFSVQQTGVYQTGSIKSGPSFLTLFTRVLIGWVRSSPL
jgi:hypothetical protein